MSDPIDPPRWSEGGGPPGSMDLVRAIARPPVLPPDLSALSRARIHRAPSPPRTRWIGPSLATAVVLGGITLWVTQRDRDEPRPTEIVATADAGPPSDSGRDAAPLAPAATGPTDLPVGPSARVSPAPAPMRPRSRSRGTPAADVRFEEPTGTLMVQSIPAARVWIDGADSGLTTPVRSIALDPGTHRLELRTDDGVSATTDFEIRAGETTRIVRDLSRAPAPPASEEAAPRGAGEGLLRINTQPYSEVFVDGRSVGTTPRFIRLPAGRHDVTLINDDFHMRATLTVDIVAGETTTRVLRLLPAGEVPDPDALPRPVVARIMSRIQRAIARNCASEGRRRLALLLSVEGATGVIRRAQVEGEVPARFAACVERVALAERFPTFRRETLTLRYPMHFHSTGTLAPSGEWWAGAEPAGDARGPAAAPSEPPAAGGRRSTSVRIDPWASPARPE